LRGNDNEAGMRPPYRGAHSRPAYAVSRSSQGGWRAEKSKPMAPYCRQTRRAPLGAPIAAVPTPGLAFPARGRIELRLKLGQPAPGGTSYWVREELRCRPGACCASAGPQAPLPTSRFMNASLSPYSKPHLHCSHLVHLKGAIKSSRSWIFR